MKNCLPVQTAAPRGSRTCSLLPRVRRKGCATLLVVFTQPSTKFPLTRAREQGQSVRGGRVLRAGGGCAGGRNSSPWKIHSEGSRICFHIPSGGGRSFSFGSINKKGRGGKLTLSLFRTIMVLAKVSQLTRLKTPLPNSVPPLEC